MGVSGVQEISPQRVALQALVVDDDAFRVLEGSLGGFCPFEASGMIMQEIRHAHFLGYILDPLRPHQFGVAALRGFMNVAARATTGDDGITPLDVHLMNLQGADIRREWRSIDLVIVLRDSKLVIAIELKIDAGEHGDQLSRYRQIVEDEWPRVDDWRHLLLFVTKRGQTPSEEAAAHWTPVSLDEVARELATVAEQAEGAGAATLAAYVRMLRRHHLVDDDLEELARKLWARHREALTFLAERRPDATNQVIELVAADRDAVADELAEAIGSTVVPDASSGQYLRFALTAWDEAPGMLSGFGWSPPTTNRVLLFEIERDARKGIIRCQFKLGPGDPAVRQRIFAALQGSNASVGYAGALTPKWRQLANRSLVTIKPDDMEFDAGREASRVRDGAKAFLKMHYSAYTDAVAQLGSGTAP